MAASDSEHSLYGLNAENCCKKKHTSEKVVNSLLPVSYLLFAKHHNIRISMLNRKLNIITAPDDMITTDMYISTEQSWQQPNFIHAPPHDICLKSDICNTYHESKVVLFKEHNTELILRQDCFAFNLLQVLLNNNSKQFLHVIDILDATDIQESPYIFLLLWKKRDSKILFDCLIITDVAILRMIHDAGTERSKQALILIDKALADYHRSGQMTYKTSKKSTVPHQKVSLFPFRKIVTLRETLTFEVESTSLILQEIIPDTSLWQLVEKSRMSIALDKVNEELKRLTVAHESRVAE